MGDNCRIAWTEASWNPVIGCTKVSPGCTNCYAEKFSERFRGVKGNRYEFGFDLRLVHETLNLPLKWKRPRFIFVNSMSDLFHKDVPDDYIDKICQTMIQAEHHVFQILTKRSERLKEALQGKFKTVADLNHIWWGVSVENKKHGLPRIDDLRASGAKNKFLSIEPLLEDLGEIDLTDINWVIVGGESGPSCRQMLTKWAKNIRDQCVTNNIPFFLKQLGGFPDKRTHEKAALDGQTWTQMPIVLNEK